MSVVTKERKFKRPSTRREKNNNKGAGVGGAVVGMFIRCQQYFATAKLGLLSIGDTK